MKSEGTGKVGVVYDRHAFQIKRDLDFIFVKITQKIRSYRKPLFSEKVCKVPGSLFILIWCLGQS